MTNVYTVRDDKAEAYLPPFYCRTDGEALRLFTTAANDADHNFCKFAGDFHLFLIGTWDELSGKLKPLDAPKHLVCAIDMRNDQVGAPPLVPVTDLETAQ